MSSNTIANTSAITNTSATTNTSTNANTTTNAAPAAGMVAKTAAETLRSRKIQLGYSASGKRYFIKVPTLTYDDLVTFGQIYLNEHDMYVRFYKKGHVASAGTKLLNDKLNFEFNDTFRGEQQEFKSEFPNENLHKCVTALNEKIDKEDIGHIKWLPF